ncbi:MAG: hypothetical protein L6U16_06930 [Porphyromonadaceae bacterium]|nr:MAG: hypothetical protein L6U16_06930 [Porphyromonadaceae bacterium]
MAEDIYIVAGSEELCGTVWDGTDHNNKMTDNGDGTYSKTFTNVAAMNGYQFKVVKNGVEWYGDEADNNITFNVTTACDVTITFNATTFKSTVTGTGVQAYVFNVEKVVAVGNGVGAWLNGAAWDPNADANKMTQVADKVYEIAFDNVPVDEGYMVKFVTNGSWADNFGGFFEASGKESDAMYNSANITFNLEKAGTVKLRLDLSKFDYATRTGAKFVVTLPGSEPAELTYFMKHPWGGGEWTWKPMAKNTEKKFAMLDGDGEVAEYGWIVNGKWGNNGVSINAKEDDTNSKWIAEPHTFSNPQLGEDCRFFYFPEIQDFVIVIPERWAKVETSFDPAPGEYTGPLTVRVKCQNIPCEISNITYFLNDNNDELLYDDAKGIVLTESTNLAAFVNFADGSTLTAVGKYVITTPTGVNDITTTATTKAQKVIENGQVLIIKDGKKYNLLGNQVK